MHTSFFGTDGIRTQFGNSPLTPSELIRLGFALGYWVREIQKKDSILIGHDTRISCSLLKAALKTGLLQHDITVHDASVIPTPALYYAVKKEKMYDVGIMITASHNQYQDNGLKIVTQKDGKLSAEDEQIIMNLYHSLPEPTTYHSLGTEKIETDALVNYIQKMVAKFSPHFLEGVKVVLDCAQGATTTCASKIFERLGATVLPLHMKPNGKNINLHSGSQYPALTQETVIDQSAHIGLAFDGDGDRLIVVSHEGTLKDGDDILAVLLDHPIYKRERNIIGTIMSNQGFEQHLMLLGKQLIRTAVGDRNVIQAMETHNALLGAEPSGHVILRDFSGSADGIFTGLRLLEAIILTGNWNIDSFKKFSQCTATIPVTTKKDLSQEPFITLVSKSKEKLTNGRIIVRYSGTEPVLRIMIEDQDDKQAQIVGAALCKELLAVFTQELS